MTSIMPGDLLGIVSADGKLLSPTNRQFHFDFFAFLKSQILLIYSFVSALGQTDFCTFDTHFTFIRRALFMPNAPANLPMPFL